MSSQSFEFASAGHIVVGPGRSAEIATLAGASGRRPFVCTGGSPQRYAAVLDTLAVDRSAVFSVTGEPTVQDARDAVIAAGSQRADVVVAIGGGSVLDLGKATAMLLANGGDPLDYLEVIGRGQPWRRPSLPVVAVPTTAGTGSEVTANAVLASPEHGRKVSLRDRSMLPAVAVVDPELTIGCPPAVTAASGLDALTQCLEPFVSRLANPLSDAVAREGLRCAAAGLRAAYRNGNDLAARSEMSICSLLGGMALANAKLGAVHGFAGVIGGMVDAPHGAICAALLAPVTEVNIRALQQRDPTSPALAKYTEAARLLTGDTSASAQDGVAWIRDTIAALDVPPLRGLGVRPDHVDQIVEATATASSTKGNPIELDPADLREALDRALDGSSPRPIGRPNSPEPRAFDSI